MSDVDVLRSMPAGDHTAPVEVAPPVEAWLKRGSAAGTKHLVEAREILRLGWPIMITRVAQFAPKALMLVVVGKLPDGAACLAGAGMGTMFCNVTGTAFISGSGFGGSSLMAQAFGAGNPERVGVLLQRQFVMHALLMACAIAPVWLAAEPLLRDVLGQPAETAALAAGFARVRLVALPFTSLITDLSAFLIAQKVTRLPAAVNLSSSLAQAGLFVLMIRPQGAGPLAFGFEGAALAMSLAEVVQALLLLAFTPRVLACSGPLHRLTWPRWRERWREALRGWGEMLALGVPAAVMTMAEWLGWECSLFQAGILCGGASSACLPLQAFPVLSQTMVVFFMLHFGFSIAAGARVGNALGAGKPADARTTAAASFFVTGAIAAAVSLALVVKRREWARLFVDGTSAGATELADLIAEVLPLVALYVLLDALGPSWSHQLLFAAAKVKFGALFNVFCFWAFAQPLGAFLAFRLGYGLFGLWAGLDAGMALLVAGLVSYISCGMSWEHAAVEAQRRSGASAALGPDANRKEKAVGVQEGAARISSRDRTGRVAKLPLLTAAGCSHLGLELEEAAV